MPRLTFGSVTSNARSYKAGSAEAKISTRSRVGTGTTIHEVVCQRQTTPLASYLQYNEERVLICTDSKVVRFYLCS